MSHSLSVVLPVWNDERNLATWVSEGVGAAAELTRNFELLILDEGSTDDTAECAAEMACRYPQVRVIRAPSRPRAYLICPVGLSHSLGEMILYRPIGCDQSLDRMGSLWRHLGTHDLLIATSKPGFGPGLWGLALQMFFEQDERFGMRLVRRSTAEMLRRTRQPSDDARLPRWLDEHGCRWRRVSADTPASSHMGVSQPRRP